MEALRSLFASGSPALLQRQSEVNGAFDDLLDEEFEVRWPPTWPEGEQVFRGRGGAQRVFAMLRESWAEWRVEAEQFFKAGDRVIVFVRIGARGAASGAEIQFEREQVLSFWEGRATSMTVYVNHAEPLEAVGLSE
jgi:ketosteroid isomerase-like protein